MSSTKIAMAQPHSFQSGAFSFMSCTSGREGSPLDETSPQSTDFKTETKKKRFHPLRNLRRMFRRKTRRSCISADSYQPGVPDNPEISSTNLEQRSCSTSRLQEENLTQNLIRNSRLNPGLSLSHDSIFTPDRADSGLSSSDLENSSLSITVLTTPTKSFPVKSQSSCSESSLLSIGSSETELTPNQSGKLSDLDVGVTSYKLSHSAAKHKMAVKPRRNHGAPRNRRRPMVSTSPLPITPETGEEGVTERSSSQFLSDVIISSSPPKTDKSPSDTKISWTHFSADLSGKEQEGKFEKTEDESDAKKEEVTGQKIESFFGRFLSRRSDKKKKQVVQEMNSEDREEEKHHYVKKCSKAVEGKGRVVKSPSHRQRVEPVEIPYGLNPNTGEPAKRRLPSPVSPSKGCWTSPTTSHSTSPQKVAWFESASHLKPTESSSAVCDNPKTDISEPTEDLKNDLKNSNFVKELSDCISSLSREVAGKRKIDEEDLGGGESVLKIRKQLSEEETKQKSPTSDNILASKIKSISSESVESFKNSDEHKTSEDGANLIKNACDFNLRTLSVSFEAIHDGYENIQIIERVKQEVKDSETQPSEVEKKLDVSIQQEKPTEQEFESKEISVDKEPDKVVRRVKPLVSEKPKDLKRTGQNLPKLNINRVPPSSENTVNTPEGVVPKTITTLVERRKSELLLLTDVEEKNWKGKIKPLKNQTSFSETKSEEGSAEETKKIPLSPEKTEISPEINDEVVLRKKSASVSDEQPELMKVFARRSLKVRESEKLAEEVQKSRDSDKENEMTESPREEKKKGGCKEEMKEWESMSEGSRTPVGEKATGEMVVGVPLLKPETASRKNLVHKYGRSLSENNSKSAEDSTILEENKLNSLRSAADTCKSERKGMEDKEEETGFKRIQQRKAEWERRAQQGAK